MMDVSKNNLEQAIAAAREALAAADASLQSNAGHKAMLDDHYDACAGCADALRDLIAALDAARGQAVAWRYRRYHTESWNSPEWDRGCLVGDGDEWSPLYAAPPAAVVVPDLALMAIGVKHFGPPAPAEWYAAARELLARLAAAQAKGE